MNRLKNFSRIICGTICLFIAFIIFIIIGDGYDFIVTSFMTLGLVIFFNNSFFLITKGIKGFKRKAYVINFYSILSVSLILICSLFSILTPLFMNTDDMLPLFISIGLFMLTVFIIELYEVINIRKKKNVVTQHNKT